MKKPLPLTEIQIRLQDEPNAEELLEALDKLIDAAFYAMACLDNDNRNVTEVDDAIDLLTDALSNLDGEHLQ